MRYSPWPTRLASERLALLDNLCFDVFSQLHWRSSALGHAVRERVHRSLRRTPACLRHESGSARRTYGGMTGEPESVPRAERNSCRRQASWLQSHADARSSRRRDSCQEAWHGTSGRRCVSACRNRCQICQMKNHGWIPACRAVSDSTEAARGGPAPGYRFTNSRRP